MLRSEKGMSKLELVITVVVIMIIVACTIVLAIGEDGFSILLDDDKLNNNVNETSNDNKQNVVDDATEKNEIVPAENKIANEIQNIVDNTLYQGK